VLALLLVHDLLLVKTGVALPQSHGLRATVERHKGRLAAELTRVRIRRKAASLELLRAQIEEEAGADSRHPRWVRVNTLKSSVQDQLAQAFAGFAQVGSVSELLRPGAKGVYVDEHVPHLLAVSPGVDLTKTEAYQSGAIILQDKASCFPAYLLDPSDDDGQIIDACAAPGNKTTHLAAILRSRQGTSPALPRQTVLAFEKDKLRALSLQKMVKTAGAHEVTCIHAGYDFLRVDPADPSYRHIGALLLDPSCSGSGIVGRDVMPELHLPSTDAAGRAANPTGKRGHRKRKRAEAPEDPPTAAATTIVVDDDGEETVVASAQDLGARLAALASFQLALLVHAFAFPAATKATYSTCSVHAEENEQVVTRALRSPVARRRGWRLLHRDRQVAGLRAWPVRGDVAAADGDEALADACIRAYPGDGRGVMGFFVAAFVRDSGHQDAGADNLHETTHGVAGLGSDAASAAPGDSEWEGFDD